MQLIVLGMHRSGTSVVTRMLNMMGAYFAPEGASTLANTENPKGFWERRDIRNLNDELLSSIGCDWDKVSQFSLEKMMAHDKEKYQKEISKIILEMDANRPWVIKEPRLCLLFPLWRDLLEVPVCIHVYRNPVDVALSLKKRNGIPLEAGIGLWELYNLHALSATVGLPRILVSYDKLMSDPVASSDWLYNKLKELEVTGIRAPGMREIRSFISTDLHHHQSRTETIEELANSYQSRLYDELESGAIFKRDNPQKVSLGGKQSIVNYEVNQLAVEGFQTKMTEKNEELISSNIQLDKLKGQHEVLKNEHEVLKNEHEVLKNEHEVLKNEHEVLKNEHEVLNTRLNTTTQWIEILLKITAAIRNSMTWRTGRVFIGTYNRLLHRPGKNDSWATIDEISSDYKKLFYQKPKQQYLLLNCDKKQADWYTPQKGFTLGNEKLAEDIGVSFIVLNRNGVGLLPRFFDSLKYVSVPLEIVFVDHASTDKSMEIVDKYKNRYDIKVIAKDSNDTFSRSNNEAVRQAQYDYVVFINNDVFITDETRISDGITLLENEDSIGLVGWNLVYSLPNYGEEDDTQHIGISFSEDKSFNFYRPYNIQKNYFSCSGYRAVCVPAVTAALVICRKTEFLKVGGFCEEYVYGFEDVDLCLTLNRKLSKQSVVLPENIAIHYESVSQNDDSQFEVRARRKKNIEVFKNRFGGAINRCIGSQRFSTDSLWNSKNVTIGFVVTESEENTVVGDFFTARELGRQLKRQLKCEIRFFPLRGKGSEHMYDMSCVDALFVMIDRYDIRCTYNRTARLIVVAWMRNWFDRWADREWFLEFDQYFCSSSHACSHMYEKYHVNSKLLRLATNDDVFTCTNNASSRDIDVSFVGSYWNAPRDIEQFDPEGLNFHLYGHGWDGHELFRSFLKGDVVYEDVPKIYSRSKIVIDDANAATKEYGSVNSRVYDAIASGALVITNGLIGAKEVFDDLLPTYRNEKELRDLLDYYLDNDAKRLEKVEQLKKIVHEDQTYRHRAELAIDMLKEFSNTKYRISIKVPAPTMEQAHKWGDYHFALSLRKEFKKRGHSVRIDVLKHWYDNPEIEDDVVLVIRGLSSYEPCKSHINIMWNISHPDKVEISEYDLYDHVFVASEGYADHLNRSCNSPVTALLQCTDADLFAPRYHEMNDIPDHKLLFVGNSRLQYRKIVKDSIEANLPITIYGGGWDDYVNSSYIEEQHIENDKLAAFYARAGVVLNDHWETMSSNGFISNRLFDAVASGAIVISDYVEGIEEIFGASVLCYDGTVDNLKKQYDFALTQDADLAVSNRIRSEHSFSVRADAILKTVSCIAARNRISPFGEIA